MNGLDVKAINPMLKEVKERMEKKTLKPKNRDKKKRYFSKLRQRIKETKNTVE